MGFWKKGWLRRKEWCAHLLDLASLFFSLSRWFNLVRNKWCWKRRFINDLQMNYGCWYFLFHKNCSRSALHVIIFSSKGEVICTKTCRVSDYVSVLTAVVHIGPGPWETWLALYVSSTLAAGGEEAPKSIYFIEVGMGKAKCHFLT